MVVWLPPRPLTLMAKNFPKTVEVSSLEKAVNSKKKTKKNKKKPNQKTKTNKQTMHSLKVET